MHSALYAAVAQAYWIHQDITVKIQVIICLGRARLSREKSLPGGYKALRDTLAGSKLESEKNPTGKAAGKDNS